MKLKKRKSEGSPSEGKEEGQEQEQGLALKQKQKQKRSKGSKGRTSSRHETASFDYRYIMAPMVGASELAFRLFCRKYGTQLCYTPMLQAQEFATSAAYRLREFPTSALDRPLVVHFAANTPADFAAAAKLAAPHCDAVDLNLGCPQRSAYVGHFGSYLLDPKDRQLIVEVVRAGVQAVSIPILVKIRLLDTFDETRQLVQQLYEAGATWIAVHARYRATYHRQGPGARDGPALLDQVQQLKQLFPDRLLITNGNTISYDDVLHNLQFTRADGLMSAEGLLDNPALFLPRYREEEEPQQPQQQPQQRKIPIRGGDAAFFQKRHELGQKMFAKLDKIAKLESKLQLQQQSAKPLTPKQERRLAKKPKLIAKLAQLDQQILNESSSVQLATKEDPLATACVPLSQLQETAADKTLLALEYLQWARHYPTTMRTIIFHVRRMLKVELTTYQLMEECIKCTSIDQLQQEVVEKIRAYQANPATFRYDKLKAQDEKEALERKRQEEGKRKAYEARMIRKAKREGKVQDLEFYLRQGATVPTAETVRQLQQLSSKQEQLQLWKDKDHSQHCLLFHWQDGVCPRGRACAFLHVASTTATTFDESEEVAG